MRPPIYDRDDILDLRGRISAPQAQHQLGISASTIAAIWHRSLKRGEVPPLRRRRGEAAPPRPNQNISPFPERNARIVELYLEGKTFSEIQKEMSFPTRYVVAGVIRRYIMRKTK